MSLKRVVRLVLLISALSPAAARADGLLVPFAGVNFGGDSGKELQDAFDAKRLNYGVSLAYMGAGVFGVEGDFAYSPDFFGKTDLGGSSVMTATGNLLLGIPIGGQHGFGVRPYALIGVGIIRNKVEAFGDLLNLDDTNSAWDFGGGIMLFLGTHVGLRGDLRYFRTFSNVDFGVLDTSQQLDFARASAGLIIRF
jgi:hypothetical protein